MANKTYRGSCVCKAITFEAELDFAEGTHKCNCTACWKRRWWSIRTKPESFRVLSGKDAFDPSHKFCATCGAMTFAEVPVTEWNPTAYVAIAVQSLDDAEVDEMLSAKVTYYDGRHDNWWSTPQEIRHL